MTNRETPYSEIEQLIRRFKSLSHAESGKQDARFALHKRIQELDREIDARVYQLYGLTEEEIKIVDG